MVQGFKKRKLGWISFSVLIISILFSCFSSIEVDKEEIKAKIPVEIKKEDFKKRNIIKILVKNNGVVFFQGNPILPNNLTKKIRKKFLLR